MWKSSNTNLIQKLGSKVNIQGKNLLEAIYYPLKSEGKTPHCRLVQIVLTLEDSCLRTSLFLWLCVRGEVIICAQYRPFSPSLMFSVELIPDTDWGNVRFSSPILHLPSINKLIAWIGDICYWDIWYGEPPVWQAVF